MLKIKELRPTSFQQVIGHTKNIALLRNALRYGFSGFTLLVGEEGIGKTTISKILAKHLTCTNSYDGNACNECEQCKAVMRDVILQNKDTRNVVTFRMSDEGGKIAARKIMEQINLRPAGGGNKVIILEECQGMKYEAQDLLLPVLEYIPDNVKIIACTTNEKALQKTFLSRASIFRFSNPSKEEVCTLLENICTINGIHVEGKSVIPRIVEYAGGKPRMSIMELKRLLSQGPKLNLQIVNDYLGIVDENYYLEYLNIIRGDMGLVIDFIDSLETNAISLTEFVKGLNRFMIKLITLRYRTTYLPESILEKSKNLLKTMDEKDLLKIQSIVSDEAPKIVDSEYAKAQFISMSFKIMSRDNKSLLQSPSKSAFQVEKEREDIIKRQMAKAKQNENSEVVGITHDMTTNVNAFLEGLNASIIKKNQE